MLVNPFLPRVVRPFSMTRTAFYSSSSNSTTHTAAATAFGTANARREIFIIGRATPGTGVVGSISSVTFGGIAGEVIMQGSYVDGPFAFCARANVPTGTSGNIVITFNVAHSFVMFTTLSVVNRPVFNDTVYTKSGSGFSSVTSTTGTALSVPSDAFVLGHIGKSGSSGFTITGDFTEQDDTDIGSGAARWANAICPPGTAGDKNFNASWTSSSSGAIIFFVFR